ncbi:wax ester/triacylglycerol synthase domain-containing protein [Terrabacter carboxydivorans]|uniref:diacylglycerol O-acyltransferase n=1 Tax=Terrabacter carboxydivorans TaxID=619730 RepID=A0ABN3LBB6_9MICO
MDTGARRSGRLLRDRIDRISRNDLTTLVSDRGPAPMNIAAVLVVEQGSSIERPEVQRALAAAAADVPRLHHRLQPVPLGCGRPYWVDDDVPIERHVAFGRVDDAHLLTEVAALACRRLPSDRPLWRATWLTGLDDGAAALVVVAHHVLADGLSGLTVLAALDGGARDRTGDRRLRHPAYARRALARDAWRARISDLDTLAGRVRLASAGARDLGVDRRIPRLCPRTSFNRPSGPLRRLTLVEAPLPEIVTAAHRAGATVNDVVLAAVSSAMGQALADRGERPRELVVSVPYSGRTPGDAGRLGNETGVVPFRIPLELDRKSRLRAVASLSRAQRGRPRAASAAPLGAGFRALARLGALQWFVDHQRLVNTFVTNVRGPTQPWRFCGHTVSRVVPVAVTPGNVGVTFDVLSYAGTLGITVVSDPDVVADPGSLASHLEGELAALTGL